MKLQSARCDASHLAFHLFDRVIHPELFDSCAETHIAAAGFEAVLRICDAGHSVEFRRAAQHGDLLTVTPLVHEAKSSRMDYYIAMGVRPGETNWKREIDTLLAENKEAIQAILRDYHIPQLDVQGNLIQ